MTHATAEQIRLMVKSNITAKYKQSGSTQSDFARKHGIPLSTLSMTLLGDCDATDTRIQRYEREVMEPVHKYNRFDFQYAQMHLCGARIHHPAAYHWKNVTCEKCKAKGKK